MEEYRSRQPREPWEVARDDLNEAFQQERDALVESLSEASIGEAWEAMRQLHLEYRDALRDIRNQSWEEGGES